MWSAVEAFLQAVFGSLLARWFPPKTAADQRAEDLQASVKDAEKVNRIEQEVDDESDDAVNADLAGRVRSERS